MIIYHGSTELVEKPEIRISNTFFGFRNRFLYYYIQAAS